MALSSMARISKLLNTKRRSKEPIELPNSTTYSFSTFLLELMMLSSEVSSKSLENLSPFRSKETKVKDLRIAVMFASKSLKMQKKLKK
jgi:hypothetical protein